MPWLIDNTPICLLLSTVDFQSSMHAIRGVSQLRYYSCVQAALWIVQSVCPSVRPSVCLSVCHTFALCFHHRITVKLVGVITNDRSEFHAKFRGQTSKVKVTDVKTRFRGVTPIWIDIPWWSDAQSLMLLRRGRSVYIPSFRFSFFYFIIENRKRVPKYSFRFS